MRDSLRTLLLLTSLGGLGGLGLGCVISVGALDCSECGNTGCNSTLVGGECFCDSGYQWADPNDDEDFECDRIPGKGGDANCGGDPDNPISLVGDVCICDAGYNWCNPDDLDDLSCCEDPEQVGGTQGGETDGMTTDATDGDTGTDTGSADDTGTDTGEPMECMETPSPWNGVEPNDADCTEDGLVFCSNNDAEGPAGSRYWECVGGAWVEEPDFPDLFCEPNDFSYGCVDNGTSVEFVCGNGPGTDCSGIECDACGADGDEILFCADGKLGGDSCLRVCQEDGDEEGITYDFGYCVIDEADGLPQCACCDEGTEGCPA